MEKAVKRIELCREKCVHGEYGLWVAICDLVLCFVMQENENSNRHFVKRLLDAASVFYRLRQKQLLQWSCLLLANGEKEKEELLKLNPKDVVFNCYLKYSLFECGLSSFSGVSWCLQEGGECGSGESIGCKEEYLDRQRDGREVEPIEGGEGALASIGRSYL